MNTNRVYADKSERIRKSGHLIVWCNLVVAVLTILMAGTSPSTFVESAPLFRVISGVVMIAISLVGIVLSYIDALSPETCAWYIVISVMVIFSLGDLLTSNPFFGMLSYALVLSLFLLYNKKMMRIPTAYVLIFGTITRAGDLLFNTGAEKSIVIFSLCFNAMFAVTAFSISILTEKYNRDIFGTLDDQVCKQSATTQSLQAVLEIVKEGSKEVSEKLSELERATEDIQLSVNNVSSGTKVTCESVEKQSQMTDNIRELINETSDKSKEIITIARKVKYAVIDGNSQAQSLAGVSQEISGINENVTLAMQKLKDKTVAMSEVVETINAISGKTNLLALNASIEAARAGEWGRSFAVVADQIRDLSQQTKASTEDIRKIIQALADEASEASGAVSQSVDKAEAQKQMIMDVETNFGSIEEDMLTLANHIKAIDKTIDSLMASNEGIVEAISQLFAVTEEVTASTDDVLEAVRRNRDSVTQATASMQNVYDTTQKL